MPRTPQESEALGHLEVEYKGFVVKVGLPDEWPLSLIRAGNVVDATALMLGDQWEPFLNRFPDFGDIEPFTQAVAEAAGIPAEGPFGGVPALLWTLDNKADEVERQLAAHGVDLVDYYRRELTLRKVFVLLGWDRTQYLIADVFHAIARVPHPDRPMNDSDKARQAEEQAQADALMAKHRENQKRYAQPGLEQAQANALRAQKGKREQEGS